MITLKDIEAAWKRIEGAVYYSPCPESIPLSEITGMKIFSKLDYLQRTGSFKERGARNALAQLPPDVDAATRQTLQSALNASFVASFRVITLIAAAAALLSAACAWLTIDRTPALRRL